MAPSRGVIRYWPSIGPVLGRYCKTVPGQCKYGVQNSTGPVLACGIGPVPATVLGQYWASTVMFAGIRVAGEQMKYLQHFKGTDTVEWLIFLCDNFP